MDRETEALMEKIAKDAAKRAVGELLISLGINAQDPLEAQQNFAALAKIRTILDDPECTKDRNFSRNMRKTYEGVEKVGIKAAMSMAVFGLLAFILYGIKFKGLK